MNSYANDTAVSSAEDIESACRSALDRIAPLWSLESFVAVNPWFGLADLPADEAALRMARVAGARSTMPRDWYRRAFEAGRITEVHLAGALASARARLEARGADTEALPGSVDELLELLGEDAPASTGLREVTVADAARSVDGTDWTSFVTERVSRWASDHFDEGQAAWASPWADEGVWAAWRAEAAHDRTPGLMGLEGFRTLVSSLPADAGEARALLVARLGLAEAELELYLHRLLMRVGGWAAWARRLEWTAELGGGEDDSPLDFLTILLVWEVALLEAFEARGLAERWHATRVEAESSLVRSGAERALRIDLVLQEALERALQDDLIGAFDAQAEGDVPEASEERPPLQAAFCIDVRSEVYRRALERVAPGTETIGFAGFFGVAFEYLRAGEEEGLALCPVLLKPAARIREGVDGDATATAEIAERRSLRRAASAAWKSFKMGAVSCFGFVGPIGLAYAAKLLTDGFGISRPAPHFGEDGLTQEELARLSPDLTPAGDGVEATGMSLEDRIATAEFILRGMSLTRRLAPVVLLAGHGSTTANNPHATGLDCGACGGQAGDANARVAAAVLNDPAVRAGLLERGIEVPTDTLFVPALHDTTTDEVRLLPVGNVPSTHAAELVRVQRALDEAGHLARLERAPALGIGDDTEVDAAVVARSTDWSQVRPEWGLAGCSAFIAAPRERTSALDLDGRAFLHSYEWREDDGFGVLELILTAPVVVASWISLQYYGSTVDNEVFGSGNKTLHNVVGRLGVLEGNGGDLRVGLPLQSVHDGEDVVHEPVRLNVIIEAPTSAMNAVIEKHEHLRHLLDHGWIHLWSMDATGRLARRYVGGGRWTPVRARRTGPRQAPSVERVA